MLLVLRAKVPESAGKLHKLTAAAIRFRLVSDYYHAGVVINGVLYHSNTSDGLHSELFHPIGWQVFELGTEYDTRVLELFEKHKGAGYDWFSLLAFILPGRISDARRWYCFEWCWYCLTGEIPTTRITPEKLFLQILLLKG